VDLDSLTDDLHRRFDEKTAAREHALPAYIICHDKTLVQMFAVAVMAANVEKRIRVF